MRYPIRPPFSRSALLPAPRFTAPDS